MKETIKELKLIRNYFGEHDKTMFEHKAFAILDKIIKKEELAIQIIEKRIKKYEEMYAKEYNGITPPRDYSDETMLGRRLVDTIEELQELLEELK